MRPKSPYPPRRCRLQVMLTEEESAAFEKKCREENSSQSSYARLLILKAIEATQPPKK